MPAPRTSVAQQKARAAAELEKVRQTRAERIGRQRRAADDKRRMQTFPRASEVTITRPNGTVETRPAYETPAALRKVAPEREPIAPYLRQKILVRDGNACRYCGNMDGPFQIDHVVAVAKGGATTQGNLVTACETCNLRKGADYWKPNPLPRRRK